MVALLIAVVVAGCGSSSSGGSATTTTANNRARVADCLRKQGVTVPNRPQGASGPRGPAGGGGAGFLFGGGQGQQQRAANPKFQAAARKCGLNVGAGAGGRFNIASNPRFKQAISKFVACVRKNGYAMPAPNLSGNGPVFDTKKVNRNDPKFVKAATKCQSLLNFGRGPTGPGAPPAPQ
jgi:hypothetical protein